MRSRWGCRRVYQMWQGRRLWFKTASIMEEKGRPVHLLLGFDLVYNQNVVSCCALPPYIKTERDIYLGTRLLGRLILSLALSTIPSILELPIHLRP